jgi:hypothetical protein
MVLHLLQINKQAEKSLINTNMKKFLLTMGLIIMTIIVVKGQNAAKEDGPEIKFNKLEHDYGTIKQDADGNCVFKFKNVGNEVLILSDVRKSCGCTTPTWSKEPILPGQTGEIKVGYDTKNIGQFSKNITVISNANNATVILTIKGNVEAP